MEDEDRKQRLMMFWSWEWEWPKLDPRGLIFFGRAVNKVGKAMFPDLWDGSEPDTQSVLWTLKPKSEDAYYNFMRDHLNTARGAVVRRLGRGKPDAEQDQIAFRFHYMDRGCQDSADLLDDAITKVTGWPDGDASAAFSDDDWNLLVESSKRIKAAADISLDRFKSVKSAISQAVLDDELGFTAIPVHGGPWIKCNRESWSLTEWDAYFLDGRMRIVGQDDEFHIYFDMNGFYGVLNNLSAPASDTASWKPADGEPTKTWCVKPAVAREADERAKKVFGKNPQEQQRAQVLATMWEEATGVSVKASSIVTYLSTARGEKKEAKPINSGSNEKSSD